MAKIIMIQGTASGVGKSILATALCRIFTQDGLKTAPFKSQNMTTVCHITDNGKKMARSQAIAAYACNIKPDPDMNPVLLKIGSNSTEVIICGNSMGIMSRQEFREYKNKAFDQILAAFHRLCQSNDIIVIEGAGSPVELNLYENDIVNMGLAKAVNAPVLLVSDIIRGGVFASLYGTMTLFGEEEKRLVKGIIINKFKGNPEYFKDGTGIIEKLCGVPVLGIIPFIDINIEDEDSLSENSIKTKDSLEKDFGINNYNNFMQTEFDRIAQHFRANLGMEKIFQILNEPI